MPQNVLDDKYGLEEATPAKAPATSNDYGLEDATPTPTNHIGIDPEVLRKSKELNSKPTKFENAGPGHGTITPEEEAANNKKLGWFAGAANAAHKYGFEPKHLATEAYEGAKGVVSSLPEIGHDIGNKSWGELADKYIFDPAEREKYKSEQEYAQGHTGSGIGHGIAAALPVIGPWAAERSEQAGTGDIGGAAAKTAAEILTTKGLEKVPGNVLPKIDIDAHGVGKSAGELATGKAPTTPGGGIKISEPPIVPKVKAIADRVVRGTPMTEEGKIAAAKEQAMTVKKPSMSETEYSQQVSDAMPDLQRIAQDNKGKIKTPRQAVGAMNNRIAQIEAPIAEHLKNVPEEQQTLQPEDYSDKINRAVDAAISKEPGLYTDKEIEKAKKAVTDFVGDQPTTLQKIEGNRRRLNQEADQYYSADAAGKRAMDVSDATAKAQRAAAGAIRDILYGDEKNPGALEKVGVTATDANGQPVSVRAVRKQVGNLINVRDHFDDAITKAEATGDWKAFDKLRSGPSIAAGGLGMAGGAAVGGPVGAILGTLLGEGVKAWGDYLHSKNPNLNTEKMFRNLENTTAPNTADVQAKLPPPPPLKVPAITGEQQSLPMAASPEEAPLFSIQQTPRLRPDAETARMLPIIGEQQSLELPNPEQQPLFGLNQDKHIPPLQKLAGGGDLANRTPVEAEAGGLPKIGAEEPKSSAKTPATEGAKPEVKLEPAKLKAGESTFDKFYDKAKDEWSPERDKLHQEIADRATAGKTTPKGRPPEAIVTVGGTGSGKTTLTRQILGDKNNLVNIDTDANKLEIPEYDGLKKSDPEKAAARVHDESKAISKRILQNAVGKGLDFVYDTSTGGGGERLFKTLKDRGYNVKLIFADVPVEEAVKRADLRAKTSTDPVNRGRIVPEDVVRDKHQKAAEAFLSFQNSPYIDEIRGYDTTTREPKEFFNKSNGQSTVSDQEVLNRIREKAHVKQEAKPKPAGKS